jgi:tetratricopeptide (TPR) repeat protein
MARYATVHLDDLEAIPGPGTLTWHPVRAHLGIRAFGTNAYTAQQAGDDVVEPHTEDPDLAHEELYFVARGRATFRLDGEELDAPAGTYVFVPDPAVHRHAIAADPGTTVLSFGGPATFTPSAWEWAFRALAARESNPDRAREIFAEGMQVHPDSPSLHYNLACLEALEGNPDAALDELRRALDREPDLVRYAREDEDLVSLREDARFRELVGGG